VLSPADRVRPAQTPKTLTVGLVSEGKRSLWALAAAARVPASPELDIGGPIDSMSIEECGHRLVVGVQCRQPAVVVHNRVHRLDGRSPGLHEVDERDDGLFERLDTEQPRMPSARTPATAPAMSSVENAL